MRGAGSVSATGADVTGAGAEEGVPVAGLFVGGAVLATGAAVSVAGSGDTGDSTVVGVGCVAMGVGDGRATGLGMGRTGSRRAGRTAGVGSGTGSVTGAGARETCTTRGGVTVAGRCHADGSAHSAAP